jgi:hypothetical protein
MRQRYKGIKEDKTQCCRSWVIFILNGRFKETHS